MRLYSFFYFIKHIVNKILLLDFEMLKVKILVMSDFLDANNEELLKDYFSEAELMVDNLESNILAIENDPANHDAIDEIFRAAHTLKGNSATVEFTEISTFAHKMEDLLDEVRSDRVQVTEDVVDTLLNSLDIIKAMLGKPQSAYKKLMGLNPLNISSKPQNKISTATLVLTMPMLSLVRIIKNIKQKPNEPKKLTKYPFALLKSYPKNLSYSPRSN